jgi:NAD-dependent SIR2 family protein deacetylase
MSEDLEQLQATIEQAAHWIREADALVACTGAGWGAPSGFGTFRGRAAGVWPLLEGTDLTFEDMSCPSWFALPHDDTLPAHKAAGFGYAFWQHRYQQYMSQEPHEGYHLVRKWMEGKEEAHPLFHGGFSFTSNIDSPSSASANVLAI